MARRRGSPLRYTSVSAMPSKGRDPHRAQFGRERLPGRTAVGAHELGQFRADTMRCHRVIPLAVVGRHQAEGRLAQARCLFEHRVEHRREVAGRAVDDPQHLGGGGLLVECLREFGSAVFDLLFEVGVGALQVRRHRVEALGQLFELVAGMDRDAMVERPGADPRRTGVELADRPGHAAGEQEAGEGRNGEPEPEHETGIQQR